MLVLLINVCKCKNVVGGEGWQFFIVLASNGDWYINIVKIEDLARLMAGGDVFATHKKIRGRVFWVGIAVMCEAELGWIVLPRIYVDGGVALLCVLWEK